MHLIGYLFANFLILSRILKRNSANGSIFFIKIAVDGKISCYVVALLNLEYVRYPLIFDPKLQKFCEMNIFL